MMLCAAAAPAERLSAGTYHWGPTSRKDLTHPMQPLALDFPASKALKTNLYYLLIIKSLVLYPRTEDCVG